MPAFLLAALPYIASFFIARALFMFASVGVSAALLVYLYDLILDLVQELAGDSVSYVAASILGLAGVGEFIGILFGAFVAAQLFRKIIPFNG